MKRNHPDVENASLDYHFMDFGLTEEAFRYQAINDSGQLVHSGMIAEKRAGSRAAISRA